MRKHLSLWAAGSALICGAASAQAQDTVPDEMIVTEYETFRAAIEVDDRCSKLSYQLRTTLDDLVLAALLDLPGIAGTSSAQMGAEAYYGNMSEISKPHEEAAIARAAEISCTQADQFLGETQLAVTADLFALIELSGDQFEAKATGSQKGLARALLTSVQQALKGAPQGTLERYVQLRMMRNDVSGKDAADAAIGTMGKYLVARAINATRRDLRRDGEQDGWILWDPLTQAAVPDVVFADPQIIWVRKREGRGMSKKYNAETRVLVLPYKDRGLEFALFPLFPREMEPITGIVSAGAGNASVLGIVPVTDFTKGQAVSSDRDCVKGAVCLRFDSATTRAMQQRVERGMNRFQMDMVLVMAGDQEVEEEPARISRMTRPLNYGTYHPPVKDMFPSPAE